MFFWPRHVAWGILVPLPGIKPMPPVLEVWSLNHWTTEIICQQSRDDRMRKIDDDEQRLEMWRGERVSGSTRHKALNVLVVKWALATFYIGSNLTLPPNIDWALTVQRLEVESELVSALQELTGQWKGSWILLLYPESQNMNLPLLIRRENMSQNIIWLINHWIPST